MPPDVPAPPETDDPMIAMLHAMRKVRNGDWVRGAPTHVLAEFLTRLEKDGWRLVPSSSSVENADARGIVQDARYVLKQLSEGDTVSDDWVADTLAALTRLDTQLASSAVPESSSVEQAVDSLVNALLGMELRHADGDPLVDSDALTDAAEEIVRDLVPLLSAAPQSRSSVEEAVHAGKRAIDSATGGALVDDELEFYARTPIEAALPFLSSSPENDEGGDAHASARQRCESSSAHEAQPRRVSDRGESSDGDRRVMTTMQAIQRGLAAEREKGYRQAVEDCIAALREAKLKGWLGPVVVDKAADFLRDRFLSGSSPEEAEERCPTCGDSGETHTPDPREAPEYMSGPYALAVPCPDCSPVSEEAVDGAALIAAERERQVAEEGWTRDHDDQHGHHELSRAAAAYALGRDAFTFHDFDRNRQTTVPQNVWPWERHWWKPTPGDRIRELVKAGGLIAAEIDRLQRAALRAAAPEQGETP